MSESVYIAAPYPIRDRAIAMMRLMELQRIEVTSRWLKEFDTMSDEHATNDLEDVARADVLLALNPHEWHNQGTGGRHVELGYALALGKPVLVVGDRSNIFHHLHRVKVVDDTEDLVKHVRTLARQTDAIITRDSALQHVIAEFSRAEAKHKPMNSPHEGYAVILEELDELWAEVKDDRGRSQAALHEAIQTAAMGLRYVRDLSVALSERREVEAEAVSK